ncbi:hypothetical protein T4A_13456 [Trichinella pseudospiralis]|uniref:Uncharacterized protein n=1 Tax=Trichinella pseudospiralis TaxID=6337 RepID=A0A0V1EI50_TRIPS|nr:hypothetical protein T4A_13456 [Trichinella pseudospiralis]
MNFNVQNDNHRIVAVQGYGRGTSRYWYRTELSSYSRDQILLLPKVLEWYFRFSSWWRHAYTAAKEMDYMAVLDVSMSKYMMLSFKSASDAKLNPESNSKLTHTWLERYTVPTTVGVIKEGYALGYASGIFSEFSKFSKILPKASP